jgi:DNA-directed RNA polymerase subunit RPC12/RpoP
MTMTCNNCDKRWSQHGRWPNHCPFCGSKRIRPVTPSSGDRL